MMEEYDILTIYSFYDNLGKRIEKLLNYSVNKITDEKIIKEIYEISKEYQTIVMKRFEEFYDIF